LFNGVTNCRCKLLKLLNLPEKESPVAKAPGFFVLFFWIVTPRNEASILQAKFKPGQVLPITLPLTNQRHPPIKKISGLTLL